MSYESEEGVLRRHEIEKWGGKKDWGLEKMIDVSKWKESYSNRIRSKTTI